MMTLSLSPNRFYPSSPQATPPSQPVEKPVAKPAVSTVDSFEKAEAATTKNRAGGTFSVNRGQLEAYAATLGEGKIGIADLRSALNPILTEAVNELKNSRPDIVNAGHNPTSILRLNKDNAIWEVGVKTSVTTKNLLNVLMGGNEKAAPAIVHSDAQATELVDEAILKDLLAKTSIVAKKIK